ncbi:MAG TPA: histone deacetylase [Vicinamibacterales bacterium]|nr:histone deacetylase [Vicinamibacterales bacterium]
MSLILVHTERFAEHQTPPGHPERPERAEVLDAIAARWQARGTEVVAPPAATREQLLRVHDGDYIRRISETAGRAIALDPDTYTSPESYDIAVLAAGAGVDAVERVMSSSHRAAFALVRPPGHHAERARAMGFCLFNNIAVAAAHARTLGARKAAIVDFDVHHGNGTQHIFETDPHVLYISTHQYPYYPGTGAAEEIGRDRGTGFTVNLPLEVGAVDEDYQLVFSRIALPIVREFEPDLLMISAGYDAHQRDPLGGMRLSTPAFAAMTRDLRAVADDCCRGRIVAMLEGGYDLEALGTSLDATIDALAGDPQAAQWPSSGIRSSRGEAAVAATSAALRGFWRV